MKELLLVSCLLATFVTISAQCHACLDGSCYTQVTIFEGHQISGQIAIDRTGNILYFHFENSQSKDYTGAYNLDEVKFTLISGIDFSFARAVDQATRDVYMSGAQGIYKYNPTANSTSMIGLSNDTIFNLQFHEKLYYTKFMVNGLFTFENGNSKRIPGLSKYQIDDFVIDKHNDVYFMSDYTIYRLKNGAKSPNVFADEIYTLATDKNGNVFFNQPATRGLYKLDYSKDELVEAGAFNQGVAFKIVFDSDNNVVYHDVDEEKIHYLTPNYGRCRVTTHGKGKKTKKGVALVANEE